MRVEIVSAEAVEKAASKAARAVSGINRDYMLFSKYSVFAGALARGQFEATGCGAFYCPAARVP